MIEGIFSKHDLSHLKAGMEATWRESLETANNLANAETPGFTPSDTDFRSLLMPGREGVMPRGEAYQMYLESLSTESVFDLERELRRMSQSHLANRAYNKLLIRRYHDLRNVMREGR